MKKYKIEIEIMKNKEIFKFEKKIQVKYMEKQIIKEYLNSNINEDIKITIYENRKKIKKYLIKNILNNNI